MVKNLPAMQDTQIQSLGQEDPLEKELVLGFKITDSSSLLVTDPSYFVFLPD